MAGHHLVLVMDSPLFLNNLFCDKTPDCLPQKVKFLGCFKMIQVWAAADRSHLILSFASGPVPALPCAAGTAHLSVVLVDLAFS